MLFLGAMSMNAQTIEQPQVDVVETKSVNTLTHYVSLGLSMHLQGDWQENSYATVEGGVTCNNISYGAVFGRSNLVDVFDKDQITNYFWEAKISPNYKLVGNLTGSLIAGAGGYFGSDDYFTEVGVGIGYTHENVSIGLSFSNWDEVNYLSPSISYSF